MDPYLMHLLHTLGVKEEIRNDAKYTAALSQQLEYVKSKTYDIRYPEMKARKLIPVDTEVPPGADTYSYFQFDGVGMAKLISNFSADLPRVEAYAEKFTSSVEYLADSYDYTIQDLEASAISGNQLPSRKAALARRGVELKIDELAAVGDAKAKLKGFLNHPNVSILATASDGTSARWVTGRGTGVPPKAPSAILADMYAAETQIFTATKEVFQPDTLLLPTTEYAHIKQTKAGTDVTTTILKTFMENSMSVSMVESWYKLATADAAGTGPRMVTYKRDPDVVGLVIPKEFEQLPPQARNLAFVVPCNASCGGVKVYQPLAIVYTDGL